MLLRVMLGLGFSVVSDAERYSGGNGITSGSMPPSSARTVHRLCHGPNNGSWDGMDYVNHVWLYTTELR